MNIRDTLSIENNRLKVDSFYCSDLAKKFGTPLYVMDGNYMRSVARSFVKTMSSSGEGAVAFASKAFCSMATSVLLAKEGMWFDAVSGGEMNALFKAGIDMSAVILHGNSKTEKEIDYALTHGVGYVVVDNYDEPALIEKCAAERDVFQEVLVRVNPCVTAHTFEAVQTAVPTSKFGFNVFGDALDFIKDVCSGKYPHVIFKGLHFHVGSQIYEASAYTQAIDIATDFMLRLKENGIECDVLDVGGGFGIYYTEEDPKFTASRYAYTLKLVCDTVRKAVSDKGLKDVFLISEPGRSIVGEAGITLYSVQGFRKAGDVNYVCIDGGMFDNPRHALYESQYEAAVCDKAGDKPTETVTIVGKCCESGDIITKNVPLQKASLGDTLAVFSTGAYNYSMASHYNFNVIPPVVMVLDGKADYIVKPESWDDLIARDNVPEFLS